MQVVTNLKEIVQLNVPCALSIGMFDGIHLGHQSLLKVLNEKTTPSGTGVVVTFSNPPLGKKDFILDLDARLKLLEENGVGMAVVLDFTAEIQNLTFDAFLLFLKKYIPFAFLVLGENCVFGKNQEGSAKNIKKISSEMGFESFYLPLVKDAHGVISSSRIKDLLMNGSLEEARELLGSPFFIYYPQTAKEKIISTPHFLNLNLSTTNILLPDGKYNVEINNIPALAILKKRKLSLFFCRHLPPSLKISFLNKIQSEKNILCQTSFAEL